MPIKLIVLSWLPDYLLQRLEQDFQCYNYHLAADRSVLLQDVGSHIRGAVIFGPVAVSTSVLDQLPQLEIIACFGVGYDGVPVEYCRARQIKVSNTPDVLTDDVADIALALILMTGRDLIAANRFLHAGQWLKGGSPLTTKLAGKAVGILGLGRIGKAIAERTSACGMVVSYHGRSEQPVPYRYYASVLELAGAADFLVVACPGGPATKHLINREVLQALGQQGILINIARGSIVDEPALIEALSEGVIKAAGLDVYADEPRVPAELLALPNAVLLPHVGSATHETRKAMADLTFANLQAHFAGQPLPNLISEMQLTKST